MRGHNIFIKDLGRVVTGKTPPTKETDNFDGNYPFITPSDLEYDGYSILSTERTVTELAKKKFPNQFIPAGAVAYTCIASVGKVGISTTDSLTNQQINSIIPNQEYDVRYIYYLLRQETRKIQGMCSGVASPIINKSDFEQVQIEVPEKPVRDSIADILSSYDDLIVNNKRRMELLEESARQLYLEWFVRLRFPGFEHTKIIKGVPEGWTRKQLVDICDDIRDTVSPNDMEPATPYIGLEHMPRRSISLSRWGNAADVSSTKLRFCSGEILFGKIRPYFHKVGIAFTDGVASSDIIVIRPNSPEMNNLTLLTVSGDLFVAQAAQTMREGSKMPRADWKLLKQYPVSVPPVGLLSVFNNTVSAITGQLKALTLQNIRLCAARDLLLPKLMSGEIEV